MRREGMLYLTNTLSGMGEVYQTAFYGLPSDVAVVGVWREGMLYLTNTLSGVGEVYQTAFYGLPSDVAVVGVRREGMLYLTNTLSGVGEVYQTAFYGLPSDVPVVGVWREGMLYLTKALSGVGELYQTAFYGLPGDVAVVGVWRELSADQVPPPVVCAVPQCPWGGTYLPATDECQYTFNAQQRKAAAEWAISWAGKACPLFCTFQFDPYKDFSHWITGTPTPTDSQSRCGWNPDTASDLTDCANFVSQAYFSAGLPLHKDWYCEFSTSAPICIRGNTLGYAGWAWAGRNNGLPQYLRERGGVDTFQTGIDSLLNANPHPDNLLHSWKSLSEAPDPEPIPSNIESLMNLLSSQGFGRGDIIYTYNENPLLFRHVLLIVGWGPYVETWAQLEQVNLAASIVPTRPPNSDYVLYVVDHGPQGLYALKTPNTLFADQLIGAKPYYASRWFTQNNSGDNNWISGSRNLVTMPHLFSVPLSSIIPSDTQTISLKTSLPSVCPPIFVLQQ